MQEEKTNLLKRVGMGGGKKGVCVKQKNGNERKTGEIADVNFPPF